MLSSRFRTEVSKTNIRGPSKSFFITHPALGLFNLVLEIPTLCSLSYKIFERPSMNARRFPLWMSWLDLPKEIVSSITSYLID